MAVAACENAKHGIAFSSGSATLSTIVDLLKPGEHVVAPNDAYGGTVRFFNNIAIPRGIEVTFVDTTLVENVVGALKNNTALLWIETPSNPALHISDISALATKAHAHNPAMLVVVDNTCLSPFFQRPLDLGADIVVHSASKYLNGHSDAVLGVVLTNNDELHRRIRFLQNAVGSIPAPFDCFMAQRGLKTLALRMERHGANAMRLAQFLEAHPKVARVSYPGLPSHPQHALAMRQQSGFGGMLTFWLKGDLANARQFLDALRGPCSLAESMGGLETLIKHPAIMTHQHLTPEQRAAIGLSDGLVRVSVGLEDVEDIVRDIGEALDAVTMT